MESRDGMQQCYFLSASELEEIYQRGYQLWNEGAFEQATTCFAEIAISNPQDRRFIFAFACAQLQQGEPLHALKLFMHCLRLQADEPWAYFHIACCLNALGSTLEARDALDATIILCQATDSDEVNYAHLYQQAKKLLAELSW